MKIEEIKELARIMAETGLSRLELNDDGATICMERNGPLLSDFRDAAAIGIIGGADGPAALIKKVQEPDEAVLSGSILRSPMVGVFYAAPSPDSDPFVQVGDRVKKGDVLCIVEAMKLMNEIQSEADGVIAEICVGNGQTVEFDQPLFRIETE